HSSGRRTAGWISAAPLRENTEWHEVRSDTGTNLSPEAALAAAKFEAALGKLKSAENENAPTSDRLALAQVRLATGLPDGAQRALSILEPLSHKVTNSKTLAEVYNDMGVAQMQLGHPEDALNSFSQALAYAPNMQQAFFNRALALRQAGRYPEAAQAF